jgi:hypothetical protein
MTSTTEQPVSRPRLSPPAIVACVLAGLLVVGVATAGIVLRLSGTDAAASAGPPPVTGPVGLVPVDSPQATSPACAGLIAKLPGSLPDSGPALPRRPIANPAPPAVAAWGDQAEPVVLRCGVTRPDELVPTSNLLQVNDVRWLRVDGDGASTWYAVDRSVYVALTLPGNVSTGPIQEMSTMIGANLPATPLRFSGS